MGRVAITDRIGFRIAHEALDIVEIYLIKLNKLVPAKFASEASVTEDDSQDYGENIFEGTSPRLEYLGVCVNAFLITVDIC